MLAGALPLLVGRPAPLQDWPNHIARVHILRALLAGDGFWSRFFQPTSFLVPNAALDLVVLGLTRLGLSTPVAAQIFLLGVYLAFIGGAAALARSLRAFDCGKLALATVLFYNAALFWGLVNYMLGIGVMLLLLAGWIAAERHPARRLAIAGMGAALLFVCHVVAAVLFLGLLLCFEAAAWLRARPHPRLRGWARRLSCVPAFAVVLLLMHEAPADDSHRLVFSHAETVLSFLLWKLKIFARVVVGGSVAQDAASLAALAAAAAALLMAGRPRIALAPAIAVVALLALVVVTPERVGEGSLLDERLAVVPLVVLAMALMPRWRGAGGRRIGVGILAAAAFLHAGVVAAAWRRDGAVFADFDARAASLPPGGIVLMGYGRPLGGLSWTDIWSPPITSIATQAVFHGSFIPTIFANPSQQPMGLRPAFADLTQPWDVTSPEHLRASLAAIAPLCVRPHGGVRFAAVTLVVLYPGPFIRAAAAPAMLGATRYFLMVDACALSARGVSAVPITVS